MIDNRLKTFLTLAQVLNYTETAKILYITQPAVSQHIKYLEDKYKTKLFIYKNKSLNLSKSGEILYNFLINVHIRSKEIESILSHKSKPNIKLKFGTTLTIGEFFMPKVLEQILQIYPGIQICMIVDNTETLLSKLNSGQIDFALLEGHFDKSKYNYIKLSEEKFIGVSSKASRLSQGNFNFEDIFKEKLLIREKGSGSREIFEHILYEHNYKMTSFQNVSEIGNINTLKYLVEKNLGISFLYKKAVEKELKEAKLIQIPLSDFNISREFNFVYLKESLKEDYILKYFKLISKYIKKDV